MRAFVDLAVRRRVSVVMAAFAVIAFGIVGYNRLALELFPDITYPSLTVQTEFPDTAPQEVENLISRPVEEAVGVLREASGLLPREPEVWSALADLEVERKRPIDAHKVLLAGRRQFRSRRDRSQAILLLLRARKLAPRDFATNFDLAGLLAAGGAPGRARRMLDEIAAWARPRELRRLRARQFALSPTPTAAWRWFCALAAR